MSKSIDVVNLISTLLDNGKYKEALNVPNEERLAESFKDNCWDIISVIIGKIQDDTVVIKPSLYGTCEQLLTIISEKSAPEEALLEFIEQIELAKNDAQFGLILPSLQDLLRRLSLKRGRSLEWCLNSISTYIEHIPIPEHHLEGQERLLMDSDPNFRRITKVYSLLPSFYRYFITELNTAAPSNEKTKHILTAFLISLLGKPMVFIDLDPQTNKQSEARKSCSTIVQDICLMEKDVFKFLAHVEICYKESKNLTSRDSNDDEKSPYEHREKINMTTLSSFFYVALSGHFALPDLAIPQVYSAHYVHHNVMLCVVHLLSFVEYSPLAKGMALCEAIFYNITSPLSHQLLTTVHFDMCKGLVNVAIYSSYESLRKRSVALIGSHVNKFDYKGRCALVQYLIKISNHSGMIGYAITLYKNSINEAFKEPRLDECFTGPQFSNMLKKICFLPHGAESDLVELADQIITSLNFLRYLTIKDTENLTGIHSCFPFVEDTYLEQLRLGLNMSKAHYEVKLKDIEEGKNLPEEKLNVSINVGGNVLDNIPKENKKEIICSALNAFHLIEGLIARLSECINVSKMQGLKMNCD